MPHVNTQTHVRNHSTRTQMGMIMKFTKALKATYALALLLLLMSSFGSSNVLFRTVRPRDSLLMSKRSHKTAIELVAPACKHALKTSVVKILTALLFLADDLLCLMSYTGITYKQLVS
eukprot:scaffold139590_cov16-Tisochrysis_lutea.AAC.1